MGISFLDRENHPRHPDFDNIGGRCEGVDGGECADPLVIYMNL